MKREREREPTNQTVVIKERTKLCLFCLFPVATAKQTEPKSLHTNLCNLFPMGREPASQPAGRPTNKHT
jgi:hypothetical protein